MTNMNFAEAFAARFQGAAVAALNALGIEYDTSKVYKLTSKFDTQDIPAAAGTSIEFFNQSTSDRNSHARGEEGCNLRSSGKLDDQEDFILLGYGVEFPGLVGGSANDAADVAQAFGFGYLRSLDVNDKAVDRTRPLGAMGLNRGFVIEATGGGAAIAFDHITAGQPGIPGGGLMLAPYERQIITAGSALKATVAVNGSANMNSALTCRFHLLGVTIDNR